MPSNAARGAMTDLVQNITSNQHVKFVMWGFFCVNLFYFWYTLDGLQHIGRDLGVLMPIEYAVTCETRQDMFRQERNALICGASLFLFFILRRLVDIQGKLHESRAREKALTSGAAAAAGGVPMGMPVGKPAVPVGMPAKGVKGE
tara:strand:- start:228 stop:662 length:435 start_codon:yes stop_codon:yes gene_type:complete